MKYHILPLLFVLFVAVGCGDKVQLRGTITFADDGEPLPFGSVMFESSTHFSQGRIKPDGTYVVGTDHESDGIHPGTYRVTVVGTDLSESRVSGQEGNQTFQEIRMRQIHERYEDANTSGLTVEVDRSTRTFDIQLERAR